MNRVLLQTLGLLSLLAFAAVGAGGVLLVKDRVSLVVRPGGARDEDPATQSALLLRDDVQALRGEFERFATALNEQLPELLRSADAGARERSEQLARALQEAACGATARGAQVEQRLAQVERRLLALTAALAAAPQPEPARAPSEPGPGATAAASQPAAPATTEPQPPAASRPLGAAPAAPAPEPAAGRSFLAFHLPVQAFSFAGRQRFVLLPELSRVGFDAKSTLHDFSGVTSRVRGEFTADLAQPDRAPAGRVACIAGSLVTGVDGRDANLREHLDVERHPEIAFTIDGFEPARVDAAAQELDGTLRGRLQVRGVERPVRMPVQLAVDAARRVEIRGELPLKLTDYGVPVPSKLGLISMQDEVKVWIALRARSAGGTQ
jgi:polyisoprenoid-binding protein YceI